MQDHSHDRIAALTGHEAESVEGIMTVYGPVDSNMTAALVVASDKQARARREA